MHRSSPIGKLLVSIAAAALLIAGTAVAQNDTAAPTAPLIDNYSAVTDARLLNPEPENWLMYKANYALWGHSTLDQITPDNVQNLVPVWAYSTSQTASHEAPPIVNDGIMFATGAYNTLFVLKAATGDLLWSYKRDLPQDVYPELCCDVNNRGVALYGNNVYMATLDAHLLAFDATTGNLLWDTTVADYTKGYTMTLAPLIVKGKVVVGVAGGEYGIRGFIQAFDSETGKPLWQTFTTALPGEPGGDTWAGDTASNGGGSVWVTGSYDPDTNITYWGIGNPSPFMGQVRPGDNLYTSSVMALNMDTGALVAHYQYNPNDSWDYDEVSDQTLITVTKDGQEMKGLIHAGRNGFFYLLDRGNDLDFVYAEKYAKSTLTYTGFGEDGRPIVPEERIPGINKQIYTCPSFQGGDNWEGMSYDPDLGYAFIPTSELCMNEMGVQVVYQAGQKYVGVDSQNLAPEGMDKLGALQAIDVTTGQPVWRTEQVLPLRSPTMSTKSGLVFAGDVASREFRAYDAKTGKILWRFTTNSGIVGVPTTFEVDGVQYVAVESGVGGNASRDVTRMAQALGVPYTPAPGGVVWVFALKDQTSTAAAAQ